MPANPPDHVLSGSPARVEQAREKLREAVKAYGFAAKRGHVPLTTAIAIDDSLDALIAAVRAEPAKGWQDAIADLRSLVPTRATAYGQGFNEALEETTHE